MLPWVGLLPSPARACALAASVAGALFAALVAAAQDASAVLLTSFPLVFGSVVDSFGPVFSSSPSTVFFSSASFARRFSAISAAVVALSSAVPALVLDTAAEDVVLPMPSETGVLTVFFALDAVVAFIICLDRESADDGFGSGG